jgi:hypothetical protein
MMANDLAELGYSEEELKELNEEQKKQLVEMYQEEIQNSTQGVDLQPVKLKINKDIQKFVDPFDNVMEEIEGVIAYKHKARGYWPPGGGKVPECSSMDGRTGIVTDTGEERQCAGCPYNQWGSAETDSGEQSAGKACKEMRRLYFDLEEYQLPLMLTLPPTSIRNFDNYISARVTKNIPDLMKKTIITLNEEESNGYTYAVAKFGIGDKVSPKRVFELRDQRKMIKKSAQEQDITQEDYMNDDTVDVDNEDDVDLDNMDNIT